MQYRSYNLNNFRKIPQLRRIKADLKFDIEVVGNILPFKVNNYVIEQMIDWDNPESDPIFRMTFPHREMLLPEHYEEMADLLRKKADPIQIKRKANKIRMKLNPHPAGQLELNVPTFEGKIMRGLQHKYNETVLFFPNRGQTCHAYCTFCFRWPQFVGMNKLKFAMRQTEMVVSYLKHHPEVTDLLITGGDPLTMKTKFLRYIIRSIIRAKLDNIINIRIGSKALSYWPYRFLSDDDAGELIRLFKRVNKRGKRIEFMAHFNHPRELESRPVHDAVKRIIDTGTIIRTQAPVLKNINDDSQVWEKMWKEQVRLGMIPYYMFIARNTGAQHYFAIPLVRALEIYNNAFRKVSGLSRTARGPVMSANPGKIQIVGVQEVKGEKVFVLKFIQARDPDWVGIPYFATFDENAIWRNDLKPAFGEACFFYEEEKKEL